MFDGPGSMTWIPKALDLVIAQLEGSESYTLMNGIITDVNAKFSNLLQRTDLTPGLTALGNAAKTTPMTAYANETEFANIFTKAFNETESTATPKDKFSLRFFALISAMLVSNIASQIPSIDTTPMPDGRAQWAEQWRTDSGKTAKELLTFCFKFLKDVVAKPPSQPFPQTTVDLINSFLPSTITKYQSGDELKNELNTPPGNDANARQLWCIKAILIGPIYINWLSEQKWKLDVNWDIGEAYGLARGVARPPPK